VRSVLVGFLPDTCLQITSSLTPPAPAHRTAAAMADLNQLSYTPAAIWGNLAARCAAELFLSSAQTASPLNIIREGATVGGAE